MRILTWNLWWRHGPWRERQEAIAATVAELDPDVCGLQEICGVDPDAAGDGAEDDGENTAAALAGRLGYHWAWVHRSSPRRWQEKHGPHLRMGNAVLSRWPIGATAEVSLPAADDPPRAALYARVRAPGGDLPFFTTHLAHPLAASAVRQAQVRALAAFVAGHAQDHPYPPVVTGDLNAKPDSDEVRLLGGHLTDPAVPGLLLRDVWPLANPDQPGHTWVVRNPYRTEPPVYGDARIDYVLVGVPWEGRGLVGTARLVGDGPVGGVWPSDHLGVVADLSDGRAEAR